MFSVPVRRGDDVISNENPSLIKIDVEGFETKVILGLVKTIERCLPVVVTEVDAGLLEQARSSVEELKNAMESFGYKGFKLTLKKIGWRYDWCLAEFNPLDSFDAVWLNAGVTEQRLISEQRFNLNCP